MNGILFEVLTQMKIILLTVNRIKMYLVISHSITSTKVNAVTFIAIS